MIYQPEQYHVPVFQERGVEKKVKTQIYTDVDMDVSLLTELHADYTRDVFLS